MNGSAASHRAPDNTAAAPPREIDEAFAAAGRLTGFRRWGTGHIHASYVAADTRGTRYLLQRINTRVFSDPPALMAHLERVLAHLARKAAPAEARRRVLTLVPTRDGRALFRDAGGGYWRTFLFIENTVILETVTAPHQAEQAAMAFGRFLRELADLPREGLYEPLPHFHDTPRRLADLAEAAAADTHGRAGRAAAEIRFALERTTAAAELEALRQAGQLPERITHNDTKLNNILFNEATGEALCVTDLDTVMPGLAAYDFGDLVRTAAAAAPEDERDLNRIAVVLPVFAALARGYLAGAGDLLCAAEREALPRAGALITLETGARFLTDYLAGDRYFRTAYPGHNLDRARAQFRLVAALEQQEPQLRRLVHA